MRFVLWIVKEFKYYHAASEQSKTTASMSQWLECPPRKREVAGSIPVRVKSKTLKLEQGVSSLGAQY